MLSLDCWCLAPESTLRHLWTSQNLRRRSVVGSGVEFTGVCRQVVSSMALGKACGARAAAMLAHTVSLCDGMLRGLLERAKLLFAIVDLTSVNGTAFRQVRVACETHTQEFFVLVNKNLNFFLRCICACCEAACTVAGCIVYSSMLR
eukprot:scaffold4204_cov140-Isochrysis_galbana.AAC.9